MTNILITIHFSEIVRKSLLSVRLPGHFCIASFKPRLLSNCMQEGHLEYVWAGYDIVHVLEMCKIA